MAVDPASLAITAVMMAANMAMNAMQEFEGPRIKGAATTTADYGTSLNYFVGTRLLPCPCFFAKPIREERTQRKGKGGKQVSYTGYGSWALHVADHDIGGILQVWFDSHLVYDATGSEVEIYPLADDYELTASMRIYTGSEDQLPDPDMEAYIEARDGADTCPAYRGTSYIYFQDVPLEALGNRYPDVKVLAYQGTAITVADDNEIEFVGQQQVDNPGESPLAVDFALTGGSGSVPEAGDLVLIVNGASRYPLDTADDFLGGVTDGAAAYTTLHDAYFTQSLIADFKFQTYYKFMGGTPDTAFTAGGGDAGNGASDRNAFQVMVFRGVHSSLLATDIASASGVGPASYDPPDVLFRGGAFDPGTIGGSVTTSHYIFKSFALLSASGNQAMPVVVGAQCTAGGADEDEGNMLAIYQFDGTGGSGSRSVRPMALYGNEVLVGEGSTLEAVLTRVAERIGLGTDEYDFSQATQAFAGYNWTQATGKQICEALADLLDVDLRPHDFVLEALPRGGASDGALATDEFVLSEDEPAHRLVIAADTDLPRRVFLTYSDVSIEQQPNVAVPPGPDPAAGGTEREATVDMVTLALSPADAQPLAERWLRRRRFSRWSASFGLTRQRVAIEPGDVFAPEFDGETMVMRAAKLVIGADGRIETEWVRDDPALAALSTSAGAPAAGVVVDEVPDPVATTGLVLDLPLLVDAHDQSAPLAYLAAGPEEPGVWTGADFAQSDTGELDSYTTGWDGITSANGAIVGTCAAGLAAAAPWVPDLGSSVTVTINAGELTAATLDELLLDGTLNLAAIESGDGWELVQFMTPTLVGELEYEITGFLRGVRGTEWAIAGHAADDRFVLLDFAKTRTLGASEIGDTDFYVASTLGLSVDQTAAFSVAYTGASHKCYAPVLPVVAQSGADWVFTATRRTRIGGTTLDGQDVPLGQASESWSLDILDGATVVRTITGSALPLTYTEADQITDWGSAQGTIAANLYQVDPTLSLRGYPLALAA